VVDEDHEQDVGLEEELHPLDRRVLQERARELR